VIIADDELEALQANLIRSHAAGVGMPLSPAKTRMLSVEGREGRQGGAHCGAVAAVAAAATAAWSGDPPLRASDLSSHFSFFFFPRSSLALRINVLAKGHSGIRIETVQRMLAALNANCLPLVPSKGTVGASGDLAPLSHLALGLMGEGKMVC
jgi:histidine ammonia-lyase